MDANKILEVMKAAYDEDESLEYFGLRYCSEEHAVGDQLENSHQWWQDNPNNWDTGCEYEYNAEMGCWDGGELNGVCTVGLPDIYQWDDTDAIEQAMNTVENYRYDSNTHLYIVGGTGSEGGNDIGELIICNPVVVACL